MKIVVLLDSKCVQYISVTTKLHNTEEFIKQGGVWEKEEASRKGQDVSGLALYY